MNNDDLGVFNSKTSSNIKIKSFFGPHSIKKIPLCCITHRKEGWIIGISKNVDRYIVHIFKPEDPEIKHLEINEVTFNCN